MAAAATIATDHAPQAFRYVTQRDYGNPGYAQRPGPAIASGPGPGYGYPPVAAAPSPYYYCPAYYPYYPYYYGGLGLLFRTALLRLLRWLWLPWFPPLNKPNWIPSPRCLLTGSVVFIFRRSIPIPLPKWRPSLPNGCLQPAEAHSTQSPRPLHHRAIPDAAAPSNETVVSEPRHLESFLRMARLLSDLLGGLALPRRAIGLIGCDTD